MIFNGSSPVEKAAIFPEGGGYAPLLHGKVVDMFYFPIIKGNYPDWFRGGASFIFFRPVFNIADSSISVAVLVILFNQKRWAGIMKYGISFAPESEYSHPAK